MKRITTKQFRDFCTNKYPGLKGESESYWRMLRYLCFGTFRDKETGLLVIPADMICEDILNKSYQFGRAIRFLEEFRGKILPGFYWSEASYLPVSGWQAQCRQVVLTGFDAEMQAALDQEMATIMDPRKPGGHVDFVTGRAYDGTMRVKRNQEAIDQHQALKATLPLNQTQQLVMGYLDELKGGNLLVRKLNANLDRVNQVIETLPKEKQIRQRQILHSVMEQPQVFYRPSQELRTARLNAYGDSVIALKSDVRKALCHGWTECDLKSSQFAILAAHLNAPLSKELINEGKSLWKTFYQHTHGEYENPPVAIKKVYKEFIYSMCFGMAIHNAPGKDSLHSKLKKHDMACLLEHPIVQELLTLRKQWYAKIHEDGGAKDVWGVFQAVDHSIDPKTTKERRNVPSVAAAVIQSIELEIISTIFDVALRYGKGYQFGIVLFQHDGATLSFQSKEKKQKAQELLQQAVQKRAKELGVNTYLEFTDL